MGWPAAPGKVELTRVVDTAGRVRPSGGQGSHMLGALSAATALAVVPADVERVEAGDRVRCLPSWGRIATVASEPAPRAPSGLTHVRADGTAHMVDVSGKAVTARAASRGRPRAAVAPRSSALRDGVTSPRATRSASPGWPASRRSSAPPT